MSDNGTVLVLSQGLRGLWLSVQLKKLGHDVTWIQAQSYQADPVERFRALNLPWQVGIPIPQSPVVKAGAEFVQDVLQARQQEIAVQILTRKGPLELSGGAREKTLKNHFPHSWKDLLALLDVIASANSFREEGRPLMAAHFKKLISRPFRDHWVLEWLSQLRRPAFIPTGEWVLERGGHLLDASRKLWYIEEPLAAVQDRAVLWAEKQRVRIIRAAEVSDIGFEGRMASGVEIKGQNKFLAGDHLVVCLSLWSLSKQKFSIFPRLGLRPAEFEPLAVWVKCRFTVKKGTRPEGMEKISSLVGDPYLPYSYSNLLLLHWYEEDSKNDELIVWCKAQHSEMGQQSYMTVLDQQVRQRLEQFVPYFKERVVQFHSFEELQKKNQRFEDRPLVRKSANLDLPIQLRMKNVYFAAPENDRGFEFLSALASELRVYDHFKKIALKKEKQRDRKIHSSRNGKSLVPLKPV